MISDWNNLNHTKRKLLLTSLKVFAEHGIDAMSVRAITKMAGAKNISAIYYHFSSKTGLIETIINFIQDWYDAHREPLLADLEANANLGPENLRDLLHAIAAPYHQLVQTEEWGYSAVRLLARIEYENSKQASDLLNQRSKPITRRFMKLLKVCAPELKDKQLRMRLNFFVNSIIQGLANYRHLEKSYFGNLGGRSFEELVEFYIDCGEQVIVAPADRC